ncbi:MAG: acylphosphatase [Candidatus Babeliales bacterium]
MSQCLHITFSLEESKKFLQNIVQKKARLLGIEGTAQIVNGNGSSVRVLACGPKDVMEDFIEALHKEVAKETIKDIEIEPFLKEKDFRGVFRVIE